MHEDSRRGSSQLELPAGTKLPAMAKDREKIFRLLETADNFIKYAKPGGETRAASRARRRYQRAQRLAESSGNRELLEQVRIRLADLERRSDQPASLADDGVDSRTDNDASEGAKAKPDRVPPGQRVVRGWPVLHEGPIPRFDRATWDLAVDGACEHEVRLTYDELMAQPIVELTSDFHCVTGWSKLGNTWQGVRVATLLEAARPSQDASTALVHAEYGYTANIPLETLASESVVVAWSHNHKPLAPKHGYPLRLVVPELYGWKSVKWLRRFELLTSDKRGFWEVRGYHNRADPWLEERYSYQER